MKIKIVQDIIDILRKKTSIDEFFLTKSNLDNVSYVLKTLKNKNFKIKRTKNKNEVIFTNKNLNLLTDENYPWIIQEVYGDEIYKFKTPLDLTKKYTVLDLGANRCYASLYFASQEWCNNVYAFELVPQTTEFAQRNLDLNPKYQAKIKLFNFGLGAQDKAIEIQRLENRDGCNTINPDFIDSYMPEEKSNGTPQLCTIKKASAILKDIVEENNIKDIIFKIDVEGAEYEIIQNIKDEYPEIFENIHIITGETHLGFENFYNILPEQMFKIVATEKHNDGTCPFEIARH